jgi:Family of unknown function (DUF5681)
MRHDPPKRKLRRPRANTGETDARDPSDSGDAENAETAHRPGKRGRHPVRQSDSEASYAVGYGRPPKHSQFKPGQSGNPKGRLPQKRNFKTMVKQVVEEQVQLREGGKERRMPKLEALFRTIMSRAFKGDPKFVASFLVILKQSGYGTEVTEGSPELPVGVDHEAVLKESLGRLGREEPTGDDCSAEDLPEYDSPPKKGKP